jgi:hypothetical protein
MTYRPYAAIVSAIESFNVKSSLLNSSGLTIQKHAPVRLNTSGDLSVIDVSLDAHALGTMGVANELIVNGSYGEVVTHGKAEDIAGFSFGDFIYVSKTGGLTSALPSEGVDGFVAGDWVIRVGVIGKNEDNPLLKDLFINFQIIGQL